MTLLDLITVVPAAAADRLFQPPPIPALLGDITRVVVLVELVVIVWCSAYVVDRLRFVIPRAVHLIIWALTAVLVGAAFGIAANLVTVPPTPAIYLNALGTTIGTIIAVVGAMIARRPDRMIRPLRVFGLAHSSRTRTTPPDHQEP